MAKVRKMLGSADSDYILVLMRLIETQSKATLAKWAIGYTRKHLLSIYEKSFPSDNRLELALSAACEWLDGKIKLPQAKPFILAAHEAAREAEDFPAAQAAARAAGQAASVIHSATHSLGIAFYGAAAIAYDKVGLNESATNYDKIAAVVCGEMAEDLKSVSIENEPNPAKINWYC